MTNFRMGWHLIYTRPNHEKKVTIQLQEKKIATYLPLLKVERIWSDRVKVMQQPVFPSYVFVYLNNPNEYYEAIRTEGSCYYVKSGTKVALMSNDEINCIKLMEAQGENMEVAGNNFQIGQQMTIRNGPLRGLTCEVIQHKGKNRILVRVSILQRSLLADIPATVFI